MIRRHAVHSTRAADFRAQRDEMGLSIRYVAAKSGYSASYLAKVERGAEPLSLDMAAVLDATFARIRERIGGGA